MKRIEISGRPLTRRHWFGIAVVGVVLVLVVVEGVFSLGNAVVDTWQNARPVPLIHRETDHDPVTGWVIEPGVEKSDFYGSWVSLTTDDVGHRVTGDTTAQASGKRALCVGGSGTFGVGVGDAQTWCARAGRASAAYTFVNAGQPGYGVGQAYLYYREHPEIPHDVLLFAVSSRMLDRMFTAEHQHFPKPWLGLDENGELAVNNTPVPLRPYLWPWATANAEWLSQAWLLKPWFVSTPAPELSGGPLANAVLLGNIVRQVQQLAGAREAKMVLIYLPGPDSLQGADATLRRFLKNNAATGEGMFVDLVAAAQGLEPARQQALFTRSGELTVYGHQWVAGQLAAALAAEEDLSAPGRDLQPWYGRFYREADFRREGARTWHTQMTLAWPGGVPALGAPVQGFSAVFDACMTLEEDTRVRFQLVAGGNAGLVINRQTVVETGKGEHDLPRTNVVKLPAGTHHLRLRYVDGDGPAFVSLKARFNGGRVEVPGPGRLYPPTVSAGGLTCAGGGS